MKPLRTALFTILFIYLALLVGVSLNFARAGRWMSAHPQALPYFALTGMAVFLFLLLLTILEKNHHHKELARKEAEKNEIKARVYEMQRRNDEIEQSMQSFENSIVKKDTYVMPVKTTDKPHENL